MDYTQNLHLPQWEATDRIHHDDFNDAMEKIDALGAQNIEIGSYVGNGVDGRNISLARTPKVLFISGWISASDQLATLIFGSYGYSFSSSGCSIGIDGVTLTENGFHVNSWHNISGKEERYIAVF